MIERIASSPQPAGTGTPVQTALSVLLGAGFTFCLFLGMAHYANLAPNHPPPEIEDLRAVAIPFLPPPPPPAPPAEAAPAQEITTVTGFDLSPSDSPVKIAVSPPNLDAFGSANQLAPPAVIQIGQLLGGFKPKSEITSDLRHVYQENEVDRIPTVLYRIPPTIPSRFTRGGKSLRTTLLLVINTDGTVGDVRVAKSSGEPEVDAIVVENVKAWGFSPAIKRGKKVRCLLMQPFIFVAPYKSPFQT
ncbi:MAG: energy transducer TonB [Opitutaceae bacterium]|nr:energy transducer TonB [Opitutaceae bacterium]